MGILIELEKFRNESKEIRKELYQAVIDNDTEKLKELKERAIDLDKRVDQYKEKAKAEM